MTLLPRRQSQNSQKTWLTVFQKYEKLWFWPPSVTKTGKNLTDGPEIYATHTFACDPRQKGLDNIKGYKHHLHQNYRRQSIPKFIMKSLMVPDLHPKPCTDTPAHNSRQQKKCLGNPPPSLHRLPLIDSKEKKCKKINCYYIIYR